MSREHHSGYQGLRDLTGDFLICLPMVLVAVLVSIVFFKELPRLEELERIRVHSFYRDVADKIRDGEIKARNYSVEGKKSRGRLSRGTWGYLTEESKILVWYREPKATKVRGAEIPPVAIHDYRSKFYRYGSIVLVLSLLATNLGLRRFRKYARERGDFIRAAAHDLRTPVATMKMLAEDSGSAQMIAVAERMRRMVLNLSDFVNLGGKRPAPRCDSLNLVQLAHEAYGSFSRDFETDYSPVQFSGDGELMAIGDADLVVQILWNLFGNELKYAAPFGQVSVAFRRERGMAVIEFADSGPGMSARERRRVFDSCYRAASALKSGKGGFGLGLCTSREFARMMGGSLSVERRGNGSVFTLKLKAAK